ncbi:MAG: hypothetical protein JJU05_07640 [Verrucomicrobia bacterium]|nr:hypothetical protein [Verrucomicrobiota bacterium]MCH8528738.1 hypothetical protein [Kiritimatiellia bacterium]
MPVVSEDWLDPSSWAGVGVAWGAVRDGAALRLARIARGGATEVFHVEETEWRGGCAVRTRLLEDVKRGARLVAGLPPSRVMLRSLHSPIQDPLKSAEIWPSLLDAALPFPLESCLVAFGESRPAEGSGLSCLAAAIRMEDLQAECRAWEGLGLDPECMVPEALVIAGARPGVHVWVGGGRSVFVQWTDAGFAACGGAKDPSREGKTLQRFLGALADAPAPEWVGPGGDDREEVLERGLALAALGQGTGMMNLRADAGAHPGLSRRASRTRRTFLTLCAVLLGLSAGMPLILRTLVNRHVEATRARMAVLYREVTGERSPPGQERLLLERWIDQEWGAVRSAADRIFTPGMGPGMSEVLSVCSRLGITVRTWSQEADVLRLSFAADRGLAERLVEELGQYGWRGDLAETDAGGWRFNGERES